MENRGQIAWLSFCSCSSKEFLVIVKSEPALSNNTRTKTKERVKRWLTFWHFASQLWILQMPPPKLKAFGSPHQDDLFIPGDKFTKKCIEIFFSFVWLLRLRFPTLWFIWNFRKMLAGITKLVLPTLRNFRQNNDILQNRHFFFSKWSKSLIFANF